MQDRRLRARRALGRRERFVGVQALPVDLKFRCIVMAVEDKRPRHELAALFAEDREIALIRDALLVRDEGLSNDKLLADAPLVSRACMDRIAILPRAVDAPLSANVW